MKHRIVELIAILTLAAVMFAVLILILGKSEGELRIKSKTTQTDYWLQQFTCNYAGCDWKDIRKVEVNNET